MFDEHRTESREALALPLQLGDGLEGITRDISPSGLYLEIPGTHWLQGPVVFELQLEGARVKVSAEGDILRVEHRGGTTGVAVRLRDPQLAYVA